MEHGQPDTVRVWGRTRDGYPWTDLTGQEAWDLLQSTPFKSYLDELVAVRETFETPAGPCVQVAFPPSCRTETDRVEFAAWVARSAQRWQRRAA